MSERAGAADIARARVDAQVRAMLAHHDGTCQGTDPEELHQFRVAIRRLRSLLKTSPVFGAAAEYARGELRWLAGLTSPVRDLDVLVMHLRDELVTFDPADRLAGEALITPLKSERGELQDALVNAMGSQRYRDLLADLAALVTADVADGAADEGPTATPARQLRKPFRKLAKAVDRLGGDPADDELHDLRIHGKRLRYAAETAAASTRGDKGAKLTAVVKACKKLQDVLGDHQDAVVAAERVRDLITATTDPAAAFVAGRLVELEQRRRAVARSEWVTKWYDIRDTTSVLL